jgi:hypothetical protein
LKFSYQSTDLLLENSPYPSQDVQILPNEKEVKFDVFLCPMSSSNLKNDLKVAVFIGIGL